jgi:hypothetical protein
MPNKGVEDWATIYVSPEVRKADCKLYVGVNCTDLAGVSEHSFSLDSDGSKLRHFLGFRRAPNELVLGAE